MVVWVAKVELNTVLTLQIFIFTIRDSFVYKLEIYFVLLENHSFNIRNSIANTTN